MHMLTDHAAAEIISFQHGAGKERGNSASSVEAGGSFVLAPNEK